MRSGFRRLSVVVGAVLAAGTLSLTDVSDAHAVPVDGWTDRESCARALAPGQVVPVSGPRHRANASPWRKARGGAAGYEQSYQVTFTQVRVTKVTPCRGGSQMVSKRYEGGWMTVNSRVDRSPGAAKPRRVLPPSKKEWVVRSQLNCSPSWCAPR
ncbi:hypothetical protein [Gordonia aurantiaca]|uniref:hypothetical protein n=1 Tax=Gordonia sp. B21 TaxID=3151852 RepID=UPI003266361D